MLYYPPEQVSSMKSLPTLRPKKRYIVFRIHAGQPVPYLQLKAAVMESLLEFLGEQTFAKASPRLIKNLCTGRTGFLLTTPAAVDSCKLALALIHHIADQPVTFQTLTVAGTIKSGKKAL